MWYVAVFFALAALHVNAGVVSTQLAPVPKYMTKMTNAKQRFVICDILTKETNYNI